MKRLQRFFLIVLAVMLFVILTTNVSLRRSHPEGERPRLQSQRVQSSRPRLARAYSKSTLSFESNQGQTDGQVKFLSRGRSYTLFLTGTEAALFLAKPAPSTSWLSVHSTSWVTTDIEQRATEAVFPALIQNTKLEIQNFHPGSGFSVASPDPETPSILRLILSGANPRARVVGLESLPGKSNYFIGSDPKKWRTNVPNYAKVRCTDVFPGVDLVYYGRDGQLELDFVVAPGADPSGITLTIKGADAIRLNDKGDLVARLSSGEVVLHRPKLYQSSAGREPGTKDVLASTRPGTGDPQRVDGGFLLLASNQIGLRVGAYDHKRPLVIDPVLSYSTYLGGSDADSARAIAVDAAGNAYVAGITSSLNFPTANALQPTYAGGWGDVYVTKLNAAGSAMVYSTYLGGSGMDHLLSHGLAVDSGGNVYITGDTSSPDFPLMNTLQSYRPGGMESFVVKLKSSGDALVYSTYLGGSSDDNASDIAVDLSGNAYVTGTTASADFPTTGAIQPSLRGIEDAFVTKINSDGSALVYSAYLGGSGSEQYEHIAVDSSGNAYITGSTSSTDFPLVNSLQNDLKGGQDAFVTKLDRHAIHCSHSLQP